MKTNQINIEERCQILEDEVLCMVEVEQLFLSRAQRERLPDEMVLKLLRYLFSWDSFKELESYWFWNYDPNKPGRWFKILDHVYRRSITPKQFLN